MGVPHVHVCVSVSVCEREREREREKVCARARTCEHVCMHASVCVCVCVCVWEQVTERARYVSHYQISLSMVVMHKYLAKRFGALETHVLTIIILLLVVIINMAESGGSTHWARPQGLGCARTCPLGV